MGRVTSRVPRFRLASQFLFRYRVRYPDALVISLFATSVVRLQVNIAHVTRTRIHFAPRQWVLYHMGLY